MADVKVSLVVREGLEKASKDFAARIAGLGFSRTKKSLWTRRHSLVVDWISLFRSGSTYGAPINYSVHIIAAFGIRVLNDDVTGLALNGFSSDDISNKAIRLDRYHMRFNALSGSTYTRCMNDLERFVLEQGEPWFKRFTPPEKLLRMWGSPLKPETKKLLRAAFSGTSNKENVAASLWMLGLR
jgi:hypothetical protein